MSSLSRRLSLRPGIAALAFALAAAAFVWPIQYRAATGGGLDGAKNQFTLSAFESRTCPWHIQLGHLSGTTPTPPPPNSNALQYLIDSYNGGACAAKRYDRTSEVLLLVLVGFGFTVSSIRRRETGRARAAVPAAV